MPDHSPDSDDPQSRCGSFSTSQQQERDITFANVPEQGHYRPPLARHAADISKAGILRADFGDIDSRSEHRNLREWNGTDQETGNEFPGQNHFTL